MGASPTPAMGANGSGAGTDELVDRATALIRSDRPLTMTARVLGDAHGQGYGDLVPAGILLAGIAGAGRETTPARRASKRLRERLDSARQPGGWPFHTGTLPTATDSALVLLGMGTRSAITDLERYRDADGGYRPQLVADVGDPEHMRSSDATAHWDQADLFTTALICHLRDAAGLPADVDPKWIETRLATRSGLFVADPWLVDLALALALATTGEGPARATLRSEVVASRNADGSFGAGGNLPLSSAAGTCALAALGAPAEVLEASRKRLLQLLADWPPRPPTRPFYSSDRIPERLTSVAFRKLLAGEGGIVSAARQLHRLTLYEDTAGAVTLGLALMALSQPLAEPGRSVPTQAPARYRRDGVVEYVRLDALPPYLP